MSRSLSINAAENPLQSVFHQLARDILLLDAYFAAMAFLLTTTGTTTTTRTLRGRRRAG